MVPHNVVYECWKQQSGASPHTPAEKSLASFEVKCRVNGKPAVSVPGGSDIEDSLPAIRQPLVDSIEPGFKPDSLGQPQGRPQTCEGHRESVSRILSEWKHRGAIRVSPGSITVPAPKELRLATASRNS